MLVTPSLVLCAFFGVSVGELHVHVGTHIQKYSVGTDISPLSLGRSLLLLPLTATVRFEHLTAKEAAILPSPVCSRIDINCWCDCYRDLGVKDYLMNHFSADCVRAIPKNLFAGLRAEDMPMLGEHFLAAMDVAQVTMIKEESRAGLSEKQMMALLKSDMNGLVEAGTNCAALTEKDIRRISDSPTMVKALTANCVKHVGALLAAVGPKIFADTQLFKTTTLSQLIHIPRRYITTSLVQRILDSGAKACVGLTSEALSLIPADKIHRLGKDCWRLATAGRFVPFTISAKIVQKLPDTAWSAVSARFLRTLEIEGRFSHASVKALISNVAKDNIKACVAVEGLIRALQTPAVVALISPECLLKISPKHLGQIKDSRIINAFPAAAIKALHSKQVAAIQPKIFEELSESHIKTLSEGVGCSGLGSEQLTALGQKWRRLSLLSSRCVAKIPLQKVLALSDELIGAFSDQAFSHLHRLEFDEDANIAKMLTLMRPEQIKTLGEAQKDELHLCHNLQMDVSSVLSGNESLHSSKRKSALGPILAAGCLHVLHPLSMATIAQTDVRYLGESFVAAINRPAAISELPESLFATFSQKHVDSFKPTACSGLCSEQLTKLAPSVKLTNTACIERMHPQELVNLFKASRATLPENIATILTSAHLLLMDYSDLAPTDYKYLGKNVPEAQNPCHSISATKVNIDFWKQVDEYCVASLNDLEKVNFAEIKEAVAVGKLALIDKTKAEVLRTNGWVL
ncbi:hypothetical protein PSACC_01652 [Paramicrosporidium saccamoebae]|uniref:Uncharacterized protein n=1 Tax=Paramicrosporidium saccamoebae TaxID=1246581 RepID=A0A2H9TLA3_9FUNG|nr:hypothetical protein PSACC_01652 [Paramicrosporidium saccamoebae]